MKRQQNIEHPDIIKMSNTQLWNEAIYIHDHAQKTCTGIGQLLLAIGRGDVLLPPIRKIIDDLHLSADRYQAICDEIEYRKQMMR